jgi:hypothetical protein
MLASDVTTRARELLFDSAGRRWPDAELWRHLTDGQRVIVCLRPESNPVRATIQLVGGTRQSIPADGVRLLRVNRNMASLAGTAPGRAIYETTREVLETNQSLWHSSGAKSTVEQYAYDPRVEPKTFEVYPAVKGTEGVIANSFAEIVYAQLPTPVASNGSQLALGNEYQVALVDFVCWRALIKDSEAGNAARAQAFLNSFATNLAVSPKQVAAMAPAPQEDG